MQFSNIISSISNKSSKTNLSNNHVNTKDDTNKLFSNYGNIKIDDNSVIPEQYSREEDYSKASVCINKQLSKTISIKDSINKNLVIEKDKNCNYKVCIDKFDIFINKSKPSLENQFAPNYNNPSSLCNNNNIKNTKENSISDLNKDKLIYNNVNFTIHKLSNLEIKKNIPAQNINKPKIINNSKKKIIHLFNSNKIKTNSNVSSEVSNSMHLSDIKDFVPKNNVNSSNLFNNNTMCSSINISILEKDKKSDIKNLLIDKINNTSNLAANNTGNNNLNIGKINTNNVELNNNGIVMLNKSIENNIHLNEIKVSNKSTFDIITKHSIDKKILCDKLNKENNSKANNSNKSITLSEFTLINGELTNKDKEIINSNKDIKQTNSIKTQELSNNNNSRFTLNSKEDLFEIINNTNNVNNSIKPFENNIITTNIFNDKIENKEYNNIITNNKIDNNNKNIIKINTIDNNIPNKISNNLGADSSINYSLKGNPHLINTSNNYKQKISKPTKEFYITDESDNSSDEDNEDNNFDNNKNYTLKQAKYIEKKNLIPSWAKDKVYIENKIIQQEKNKILNKIFKREKIEHLDLRTIFTNIKQPVRGESADWKEDISFSSSSNLRAKLFT